MLKALSAVQLRSRMRAFLERYERAFMPLLLIGGFLADVITFRTLKAETTFLLLGLYVVVAMICMVYAAYYDARTLAPTSALATYARAATTFCISFAFGSLLSSALLFYWYSGAFAVSWPVITCVAVLMATNEAFRHVFVRPFVQISVFSFALLSFFTQMFPYVFRSLDAWVFVLGLAASTLVCWGLVRVMVRVAKPLRAQQRKMYMSIGIIACAVYGLYIGNIIPPIPLSIREAGVYHDITVKNGEYYLTGETEAWWDAYLPGQTIHLKNSTERVYVYTSIFAPTDLSTTMYHQWEYFDEAQDEWVKSDILSYPIVGGRQDGYRGFSFKTHLTEGKWRVSVQTERGQVLGRIPFTIVYVTP